MKNLWTRIITTSALAFMLCLIGLVISGQALAQVFVDNGNGTVTAKYNGLMWQKETDGPMNWHEAMSYASTIDLGGYSGWRLPTMKELMELYHPPCHNCYHTFFNVQNGYYWTSESYANTFSYGLMRNNYSGDDRTYGHDRNSNFFVRVVR